MTLDWARYSLLEALDPLGTKFPFQFGMFLSLGYLASRFLEAKRTITLEPSDRAWGLPLLGVLVLGLGVYVYLQDLGGWNNRGHCFRFPQRREVRSAREIPWSPGT